MIFCRGTRNFLDLNPESRIQLRVTNTHIDFIGFYAHGSFLMEKVSKFTCILWMDVNKLLLYIYVNSLF